MDLVESRRREPANIDKIEIEKEFKFLLDKVRRNRNLDFSHYRPQVLKRRIEHRLHLTQCATYLDYIMLLNKDPQEYDRLIESLTIKVSEFFRDPPVFDLLGEVIIPEVISQKEKQGGKRIRAWSCGSALGQEAFSMAILFCENLGNRLNDYDVQIIGTDIDQNALEQAAWSSYESKALGKMKPHLLYKYFTRFDDDYIVNDRVRALVTFRYHDVVSGNPMSEVDLVLCRNLLIYFERELQEEALYNIHSAMKSDGLLILGMTETLPVPMVDYFEAIDPIIRAYVKK
ncbi:MAG: protein-glutamate O-methyltransferase CheR [Candidatus Neomarinimicrobiota bacterium]